MWWNVKQQPMADTWANIGGGGQTHISIVLEQKTIIYLNIGGHHPPCPTKVSATSNSRLLCLLTNEN